MGETGDTECMAAGRHPALPPGVAVERRRAGRPAQVSPELLPLLRHATTLEVPVAGPGRVLEADETLERPLVGVVAGLLISAVLWGCLAVAAWSIL